MSDLPSSSAPNAVAATFRRLPQLLLAALALAAHDAAAVDKSKFRTCSQGSFCRRYRGYVSRVEKSGGTEFAHEIEAGSIQHDGHVVRARIAQVHDPSVKPLLFELKFFRDIVNGRCGVVRLTVDEDRPLHERFRLREGDVTAREEDLQTDDVEMTASGEELQSLFASSAPGGCQVTLRHRPFELDFAAGGRVLQRLNARHFLNFERYREKEHKHAGLVDATDVDQKDLWEEEFGGHKDTKPRGPAAVGLDVTFEAAAVAAGLAEHATKLHLGENGFKEPYRFYNLDVFEYEMDVPMALYGAVPFMTAVHRWPKSGGAKADDSAAATASGFFFPNPSEGHVMVDPPGKEGTHTWWAFESGVLDVFMFAGPSPQAVMEQYHTVTGWPRMPPISTLGKHQSRWNYVDVADSLSVNRKFDEHDIPYDVLWLDIEHTDGKKYFTWHPSHFGKADELLDGLEATKRKLVTIIDPHIKKDDKYDVFTTLKKKDLFTKKRDGQQYDGWCWPGTSYYADFCNPDMRNQWAKFFAMDYYPHNRKDLYTWNDMNEPSVFNGPEVTMPRDNLHKCHMKGYEVEHRDMHNVYGFYHHMATVQGQLERAPDVRPFVLTRSFFAGSHKHGAVWTGDNQARWEHLARSVPMLVSLCLSGISFVGADVPGFFYDAEPELFRRWHQLGIWYPFYRGHAHLETKRREPWMLGEEVTSMVREQVTVRYQLLPMWYTLFAEWAAGGAPILRPVWYHTLDDELSFEHANDQYLVGDAVLVRAANAKGMTSAKVYLPEGEWFDFWDGRQPPHLGRRAISVKLSDTHIPVYVKSGAILCKKMRRRRSTGAMAGDPYTIVVYGGQRAKGRLYADDGSSHEFQSGSFVYDELVFNGSELRAAPAGPLPALGEVHGLQGSGSQAPSLLVERIAFLGLPRRPTGARSDGADGVELQVAVEEMQGGSGWIATIKKPAVEFGTSWSIELVY